MTIECNDGEMYNIMDNSAGKPIYCRIARWEVQSMADKTVILQRIGNNSSFTRSDMQAVIEECGYNTSESITNHMITRMLAAGDIVRIGRNRYCVSGFQKTYQFPHSEFAVAVADEIVDAHPYLEFRVFELVQLNEFVNHQMAHNIVFVSVEGGLEEDVFNTLWNEMYISVVKYLDTHLVIQHNREFHDTELEIVKALIHRLSQQYQPLIERLSQ